MNRQDAVIAMVLGDAAASPELTAWLATEAGQRTLRAYQRTVAALGSAYGEVTMPDMTMVYYTSMATPIGRVFVAATEAGVTRISFRCSEAAFVAELRRRLGAVVIAESGERLQRAVSQLDAYFGGRRRAFDVAVDWRLATPFQRRVLTATRRVPAGRVVSYGDIAQRIGQPAASRAVGQALGRNPLPILIPCHRVLAGGGGLGGYTGGLDIKRKLLGIEGAEVAGVTSQPG